MIILCLWINNRIFAAIFLNDILMNYGYVKVAAAVPRVKVADCKFNAREIEKEIIIAEGKGVQIIAFPELCVTGYTCGDLFAQQLLLEEAEMGLIQIVSNTRQLDIIAILGMPIAMNGVLLNAAVVIQKGKGVLDVLLRHGREGVASVSGIDVFIDTSLPIAAPGDLKACLGLWVDRNKLFGFTKDNGWFLSYSLNGLPKGAVEMRHKEGAIMVMDKKSILSPA